LLLAQFRRSENGIRVLYGFFASAVILLLTSWGLALDPSGFTWLHNAVHGVPVKDAISQSTIFLICAFALIWRVCDLSREGNWRLALVLAGLAALFIGNMVFVALGRAEVAVAPFLILVLGWRLFGWKGAVIACTAAVILATAAWTSSPYLRERLATAVSNVQNYQAARVDNDVGDHLEFLRKSFGFVREAPLIGHGTGSIGDLFRRSAAGETGAAAVVSVNPHNQIFAVAIQLGLLGAAVLLAMWIAHYFLFRTAGVVAWIGTVVVVENVISSLTSSHLFDFMHGWLYVFGVGVAGGMVLRETAIKSED
jgi:O-antigen ligase